MFAIAVNSGCQSFYQETSNENAIDIFNKAEKSYYTGQLSTAEQAYRKLIEKNPNYAKAYFRLGNIYVRTGQEAAAIEMYNHAARLKPEDAKVWYNISMTYLKLSQKTLSESLDHPLEAGEDLQSLVKLKKNMDSFLQK